MIVLYHTLEKFLQRTRNILHLLQECTVYISIHSALYDIPTWVFTTSASDYSKQPYKQ